MMEKNRMGVLLFLASEVGFFSILILSYLYYQGGPSSGPNAANSLDPATAGIYTACLLASSLTLWQSEKNVAGQNHGRMRMWLLVTLVLGIVFIVGQALEYLRLIRDQVTINRNQFGSTFFTLTGFHGLHVIGGLIALAILFGLATAGHFRGPHSRAVQAVSYYWHFVDVVWIVIFAVVYVWPRV
jgi:heme/copper-type cytochrome/quinol oxidase subunit 3